MSFEIIATSPNINDLIKWRSLLLYIKPQLWMCIEGQSLTAANSEQGALTKAELEEIDQILRYGKLYEMKHRHDEEILLEVTEDDEP